jgi:hypothetical protein
MFGTFGLRWLRCRPYLFKTGRVRTGRRSGCADVRHAFSKSALPHFPHSPNIMPQRIMEASLFASGDVRCSCQSCLLDQVANHSPSIMGIRMGIPTGIYIRSIQGSIQSIHNRVDLKVLCSMLLPPRSVGCYPSWRPHAIQ